MAYDRIADLPVWRLRFDEHPGLVVRVTVPTAEAQALAPKLVPLFTSGRQQDVVAAVTRLASPMADSLLSWTLTWNGRPVPCTRRGVRQVDVELLLAVLREWIRLWPAPAAVDQSAGPQPAEDPDLALLAGLPMIPLEPEPADEPEPDLVAVS